MSTHRYPVREAKGGAQGQLNDVIEAAWQRDCGMQPLPKRIDGGGKESTLADPRPRRKGRKRRGNYKRLNSV
ncbi:MAG: hypothetical protein ITD31_05720 [Nitrosospira sp.]|nr:hypothetical protein [Nitrosospira sp.]